MICITAYCRECDEEYSVVKNEKDKFCIECTSCKKIIFKSVPVNGYIYILSNSCMPNLIKIGYTERSVFERLNELNSATGVPEPFIIEATFICENPKWDEQLIHSELSQKRNNKNRDFFSIDAVEAYIIIEKILKRPPVFIGRKGRIHQKNIEVSRKKDEKKKQEAADEKNVWISLKEVFIKFLIQ